MHKSPVIFDAFTAPLDALYNYLDFTAARLFSYDAKYQFFVLTLNRMYSSVYIYRMKDVHT